MSMKMNTLLGVTDHAQAVANKEISDYTAMFKSKGGQFVGELKTYEPHEGFPDKPTEHSCRLSSDAGSSPAGSANYMWEEQVHR